MNKKILFVIPYMHEGGAQRALSTIQAELAGAYEIETLVNTEKDRVFPNTGNVISMGIDKAARTDSIFFQFSVFINRLRWLRQLKKQNDYYACISFMDSANIANILSRGRCRKIISIRTSYRGKKDLPQYRFLVKPLARILYSRADVVVAVSEELKRELEEDLKIKPNKLCTITNGFDLNAIKEASNEDIDPKYKELIAGKKVILTAGRLNVIKHQWHLIRAFSLVLKQASDVVLIVAGTGRLEHYLMKMCEELNIQDNVFFVGFVDNIYKYMKNSDVFALTSCTEGFPNALGEALCVGVPCVATDFKTGAREILAPNLLFDDKVIDSAIRCEYGILTPVCSGKMPIGTEPLERQESELAKALLDLLTDDNLNKEYRSRSIERSRSLDVKTVIDKWINVIEG